MRPPAGPATRALTRISVSASSAAASREPRRRLPSARSPITDRAPARAEHRGHGLVRHAIPPRSLAGGRARQLTPNAATMRARAVRPRSPHAGDREPRPPLTSARKRGESESRFGSVPVGTAEGTPREGALMVPVSSRLPMSSSDQADLRSDWRVATLARSEPVCPPARAPSAQAFELRCAHARPAGCAAVLRAGRAGEVVACTREHGARVHGFTAVWCGPQRLGLIAAVVTRPGGGA
jgi:hypothetical protein